MVGRSPSLSNSSPFEQGNRPFFEALAQHLPTQGVQAELQTILKDSEPAFLFTALLDFGRRLRRDGIFDLAAELFTWLAGQEAAPQEIKDGANRESDAIQGKGAFGPRAEFLLTQILKDAVDPKLIIPMLGASIIGSLSKAVAMGRLLQQPAMLLTRGTGAKLLAGAAGFGVEGFAFATLGRGLSKGPQDSFGSDLARSYVGLGALKFSRWAGNRLGQSMLGRAPGNALQGMHRHAVPQLTMFMGMLLAHKLETKWGLRPETNSDSLVVDTLAAMISLQLGSKLGHAVLGKEFHLWQRNLEMPWNHQLGQFPRVGLQSQVTAEGIFLPGILFSEGGKSSKGQKGVGSNLIPEFNRPREVFALKGEIRTGKSKKWTEVEIDRVVKAIVAQDGEFYPKGNPSEMTISEGRFKNRWYRVNGEDLTLETLTYRVRKARGLKGNDTTSYSNSEILRDWKRRIFGIDTESQAEFGISGEYPVADPQRWPEVRIDEVVKMIVAQDGKSYPAGSAASMSISNHFNENRWYRVDGEDLTLGILARRVRQARGLKAVDVKSLSDLKILREWKRRLFGIEDIEVTREAAVSGDGHSMEKEKKLEPAVAAGARLEEKSGPPKVIPSQPNREFEVLQEKGLTVPPGENPSKKIEKSEEGSCIKVSGSRIGEATDPKNLLPM